MNRAECPPLPLATLLVLSLMTSGCSPVGTAVGVAATTINLATQERGLVTGVDDNLIWVGINERMLRTDSSLFQKVSLQVHEGRVLLTGFVQQPEHRVLATELAWQSEGVREVQNEIKLGPSLGADDYAEDVWLISRLRLKLMADSQVRANNYSIDSIRSTIYLMGVAQDETELQRVVDHARDIAYVAAVVNRVRLLSDPLPPLPAEKPIVAAAPSAAAPPVEAPAADTAEPPPEAPAAAPVSEIQATPLP